MIAKLSVFLVLLIPILCQNQQQCPPRSDINPCSCSLKKNGLDVLCEFTDSIHINKAMSTLKGKQLQIFYLKLRHNNLPKLQGFIFLGLDIYHLTIHNSTLAVVEETSLSSIGKMLTQLDLSQNWLSNIPTTSFKNLHQLLILNINHNKISNIHGKAFTGLDTLEILTLYENKISLIDPAAFLGLEKKLRRLNLGGNQLTVVPKKPISILENLRRLELQENRINSISIDDFEGLSNLDSLMLAHNQIKSVPLRVFENIPLLNSLELEGNHIHHIHSEAFTGLEANLQYLRLGDNAIHSIPTDALKSLHRLRHLDLRSNNISFIAEDAFNGYGDSITFLNLQKNDIKSIPTMVFENLNSLETLNLQNNKLMHLSDEVMEPVLDTLRAVDITDNPLVCNCELTWYMIWMKNLKDDDMMQKKRAICVMLHEHREYNLQKLPVEKMKCMGKAIEGLTDHSSEELPPDQIKLLKNAFDAFDQEKKGFIDATMVGTILGMLGVSVTEKMLSDIIAEVDADGSGQIEFEEFVTLSSQFLVEEDQEAMQSELKEAFRLYDKEGNGYITTNTLREILQELDDKITPEDLDMMIEEIDADGSGTVDFDEFMEVMTGGDD